MERECCLSLLIMLLSGTALLACGWWPVVQARASSARRLERVAWRGVWLPVAPACWIAAWCCGWAVVEPDPVPEAAPLPLLVLGVPLALLFARAAVRAGWSLMGEHRDPGTATVGLLRPWILFSPYLAKSLDDRQLEAALAHERAHVRHRDPLRMLLAQLATDLQWPWPQARARLQRWLLALELARDEEARAAGVEGIALAEAILTSARFRQRMHLPVQAALTGDATALKERIGRLLAPLPAEREEAQENPCGALVAVVSSLVVAVVLGALFGERVVHALFSLAA